MVDPKNSVKWTWRTGSRFRIEAEVAATCLLDLQRTLGRNIEPEDIVAAARQKENPLHTEIYNCSEREAAQLFREHRARTMLNSLRHVRIDVETGQEVEQIVFVNVRYKEDSIDGKNEYKSVYMQTSEAMEVQSYRDYVLEDALRYAVGFQKRVQHLKEFSEVCNAINKVKAKYGKSKRKELVKV